MKVEKGKTFEPITITLETEKEAIAIWHLLNMAPAYFEKYVQARSRANGSSLTSEDLKIPGAWDCFNEIFSLPREKY